MEYINISQFIWISSVCGSYQDSLDRGLLLTREHMNPGPGSLLFNRVKSSLLKFYGCHHNFLNRCGVSLSQMTARVYVPFVEWSCPFLVHHLSPGLFVTRITRQMQLVTGAVIADRSGAPEFTLGISVVAQSLVFYAALCGSLLLPFRLTIA